MSKTKSLYLALLLSLSVGLLTASCGDEDKAPTNTGATDNNADNNANNSVNNDQDEDLVTWHGEIRPLIEAKCLDCHHPGGAAPDAYDFSDLDKVRALAPLIRDSVMTGRMPPWQAVDGCNEYAADLSLASDDIEMIRTWTEGEMAEGKEEDYVKPSTPADELGLERFEREPDMKAGAAAPYTPNQAAADDYRCFVIDPQLESERFMTAFQVEVDNAKLLHHVVMFTVPGDAQTLGELDDLENEDETPGYTCYGGPRTSRVGVGMAWAPGSAGLIMPENIGMPIAPNTRFVVQMHYNTLGGEGTDASKVKIWYMEEGKTPAVKARLQFFGNLPFEIPPGVNGVEAEECGRVFIDMADLTSQSADVADPAEGIDARDAFRDDALAREIGQTGCVQMEFYYNFPIQLQLLGIGPHMHTVGKNIKVEVLPVDDSSGSAEIMTEDEEAACLIDIDRWDFNWQRGYQFKERLLMPQKGVIRLTCRYDNSLGENPVHLGEGTGDEMCLALGSLLSPI